MSKVMTFYKVMGGLFTTNVIGGVGTAIGYVTGAALASPGEEKKGAWNGGCVGNIIGAAGSIGMGIKVGRMPDLKSAGYAQAIYGGIHIIAAGIGLAMGRPLGEVTDTMAKLAAPIAPAMLIGKVTKERMKGEPRADIQRAREHAPALTANLSDEEVATMLRRGAIVLPERGAGLTRG